MKKLLLIPLIYYGFACYGFQLENLDEKVLFDNNLFDTTSIVQSEKMDLKIINGKHYFVYLVKSGDGWYKIAKKFNISYSELRLANKETDDKLFPGLEILIPKDRIKPNDPFYHKKYFDSTSISTNKKIETNIHIVKRSQTLFGISKMYGISVLQLKKWNNLSTNTISPGQKLMLTNELDLGNEISKNENKNVPDINYEFSDEKIVFAKSRNEINENGLAAIIDDDESNPEKYYALHRTAPVGTIIRVLCIDNSKTIYVKIIGQLSETDLNDGIIIKISKASANKLEVNEKNFNVNLLYGVSK